MLVCARLRCGFLVVCVITVDEIEARGYRDLNSSCCGLQGSLAGRYSGTNCIIDSEYYQRILVWKLANIASELCWVGICSLN